MIWTVLLVIILLFVILLAIKSSLGLKVCVICMSVSLTWLALLGLYHLDRFNNQLIIAILMGQSATGLYYLIEKKLAEGKLVFRLPILLTLTYAFYVSLTLMFQFAAGMVLAGLWLAFFIVYVYRTDKRFSAKVRKLIECCSRW